MSWRRDPATSSARDEVGAKGADDVDSMESPDGEGLGNLDDAVDLGALAVRPPDAGSVDEDLDRGPHEGPAAGRGDVVLEFSELGEALLHQTLVDLPVET